MSFMYLTGMAVDSSSFIVGNVRHYCIAMYGGRSVTTINRAAKFTRVSVAVNSTTIDICGVTGNGIVMNSRRRIVITINSSAVRSLISFKCVICDRRR